ncbi:MAG: acetyl-CoA C-acyltransferase [Balneolaceae bacterium]
MNEVVVVQAKRTPIGSWGGRLSGFSAPELGGMALFELIKQSGLPPNEVDEVLLGQVLTAGCGQAPARQAALKGGLPNRTPSTGVNKVCASGMKAVMLATDQIRAGQANCIIAGGMESMSRVPYYLPKERFGARLGHSEALDGILKDGLWDVYNDYHMGCAAELCAREKKISRERQDQYAIRSYKRAQEAIEKGWFNEETIRIKIRERGKEPYMMEHDEEPGRVRFDKVPLLKPAFENEGSVTAANASTLSDGAAGLLLMSKDRAASLGLAPIAKILSHASTAREPEWFTTAPADAIPAALKRAGASTTDIDLYEINEAFSVVALANMDLLDLSPEIVNIQGGAVSLGHPIGCSGARILVTLLHALARTGGNLGCAAVCNGGGGASAMVVERM